MHCGHCVLSMEKFKAGAHCLWALLSPHSVLQVYCHSLTVQLLATGDAQPWAVCSAPLCCGSTPRIWPVSALYIYMFLSPLADPRCLVLEPIFLEQDEEDSEEKDFSMGLRDCSCDIYKVCSCICPCLRKAAENKCVPGVLHFSLCQILPHSKAS